MEEVAEKEVMGELVEVAEEELELPLSRRALI
jgi:hypothetical protein